jgi:hypothetical protein
VIRVAILADTHGDLDARVETLVADCDLAVHGGDIRNGGVVERLRPWRGRVFAITGNNDLPRMWPPEQWLVWKAHTRRWRVAGECPSGRLTSAPPPNGRSVHREARNPRNALAASLGCRVKNKMESSSKAIIALNSMMDYMVDH